MPANRSAPVHAPSATLATGGVAAADAINKPHTIAHVTHEAVEQLGGIGTVLEGMMISPVYQRAVKRSILVGPTATHMAVAPAARLGEHGTVLYSSVDGIDANGYAGKFRPVEWAFKVAIVYGTRKYAPPGQNRTGEAEVLLIDIFRANRDRLNTFKGRLWQTFGIDCMKYQSSWDFEEYARLAEPAYYALLSLLGQDDLPCTLFAHEFMGLPTALQCILESEGHRHFHTVFHAHECSTARRLVEEHPGHDTMFYNVLDQAMARGQTVDDVFGDQHPHARHALVSRAHLCDGIIAVGDRTRDELRFLSPGFDEKPINVAYNGLPLFEMDLDDKLASRAMLLQYAKALLDDEPDVLMTHVTRPVVSKGMWRDLQVCHHLDEQLGQAGRTGVLFILTSGGGTRRPQDIQLMEEHYGWPRNHREGYPDLVGPEVDLAKMIEPFNKDHKHVQVVLINQFGWSAPRIGKRLPVDMHIGDLRKAADVEFGMAVYEPFGISPLEPLGAGAICVISNVCGCEGFVNHVTSGKPTPNVLVADYTRLPDAQTIDQLKAMTDQQRGAIEEIESKRIAKELYYRLPNNTQQRAALVQSGQELVARMGWDQVVQESILPMLDRIRKMPTANGD